MIVVTIELWPSSGGPRKHLGTAVIANDGSGSLSSGNYFANFASPGRGYPSVLQLMRGTHHVWKRGEVKDFPRKRLGAWHLLLRALRAALQDQE